MNNNDTTPTTCPECGDEAELVGRWNLCEECHDEALADEAADRAMDAGR